MSIRADGKKPTVVHIVAIFDDRHPDLIDGIADVVCDENGKPRYDDLNNGAFTEDGFAKVLRTSASTPSSSGTKNRPARKRSGT